MPPARKRPAKGATGRRPAADTYTAVQAARVIGISEKRVRQLVDAGALELVAGTGPGTTTPLRVTQESAHKARDARRSGAVQGGGVPAAATVRRGSDPGALAEVRAALEQIAASQRLAIETAEAQARRTEQALTEQLAAERARATTLEAENRALRARLERRRLFRRGAGERSTPEGSGDRGVSV